MRAVRKPLGRDHKNASLLRLFSHAGLSLLRRPFGLLLPRGGALRQHSFAMFGAGPIRQRHLGVADPPGPLFRIICCDNRRCVVSRCKGGSWLTAC